MSTMNSTVEEALPVAVYAFGDFRLDARRIRLTREGTDVPLTPKAFAVLEHLVRRPGQVVEKQALLAAAWPKVVVEESNLSQTIYLLRRALGEHPSDHRYIVTVPGRGYRFVADVRVVEDAADGEDSGARVGSREAVAAQPRRARAWRRAAVAATLLLVASSGALILAMQSRSVGTIAAPATTLRVGPPAAAPAHAGTSSSRRADREATLARARFLFARREPGDLQRSQAAFEEVIASDANDAAAWAGLAGVLLVEAYDGARDQQSGLDAARIAAERAIAIDPTLAEAHVRLAMIRACVGDERGARASLAVARRLGPDVPLVLAGAADEAARRGDFAAAAQLARRSVDRDPLNLGLRVNLAAFLVAAHRLDEAEAEAKRAHEIYPVDAAAMLIGQLRLVRGDVPGAVEAFAGLRHDAEREHARALLSVAARRKPEAEAALQRLAARVGRVDPFVVAEAYALHGDRDRAFEWLERAAPSNGGAGVAPLTRPRWTMAGSPLLAQLHADPRWREWERAAVSGER